MSINERALLIMRANFEEITFFRKAYPDKHIDFSRGKLERCQRSLH